MDPDDYTPEKYNQHVSGYSVRTDRYCFNYWRDDRKPDKPLALKLHDHQKHPDENVNLAGNPDYANTVAELRQQLKKSLPGKSKT